jgi:hypothetical protein
MRWHTLTKLHSPAVGVRFLAMLMIPAATFVSLFVMGRSFSVADTSCRCSPIHPWSQRPRHVHIAVALVFYSIGQNNARFGLLTARAVVTVIPILAIFAVFQRHLVQRIAVAGRK